MRGHILSIHSSNQLTNHNQTTNEEEEEEDVVGYNTRNASNDLLCQPFDIMMGKINTAINCGGREESVFYKDAQMLKADLLKAIENFTFQQKEGEQCIEYMDGLFSEKMTLDES